MMALIYKPAVKKIAFIAAMALALTGTTALANVGGDSYADMVLGGEGGGNIAATTKLGTASGAYQFTYATLVDMGYIEKGQRLPKFGAGEWTGIRWTGKDGITSRTQFLNDINAQNAALGTFTERNWNIIGKNTPEGQTVNGVPMSKGGALYAAHMLGPGGYNKWASCGFQASCLDASQAAANNMDVDKLQRHLMKRVAEGSGVDPSNITSSGSYASGFGGNSGPLQLEMPEFYLMPWSTAAIKQAVIPGQM